MQQIKEIAEAVIGFALLIVMFVVASMIGVLPFIFGLWMWNQILG